MQEQVEGLGSYLDSRIIKAHHIPQQSQFQLRKIMKYYPQGKLEDAVDYNCAKVQVWDDKKECSKKLFKKRGTETDMVIRYLDIPQFILSNNYSFYFYRFVRT